MKKAIASLLVITAGLLVLSGCGVPTPAKEKDSKSKVYIY